MSEETLLKKCPLKIGTHNGVFHCDEVLGTYMLQVLYPDSIIVRSRDDDVLKLCDIVIDVGNKYNPSEHLYDHHQRDFNESISTILPGRSKSWKTKLSSAGLVYCHFGHNILKKISFLGEHPDEGLVEAVFDHVYENFIQEIDGIDNGVPMYDGEPSYHITTNLSNRVNRLNKQWNVSSEDYNEADAFFSAQKLVGKEFESRVKYAVEVWWPARSMVSKSIINRFEVHPSGQIMELSGHCPWKDHFFVLEKELEVKSKILYVIFSDSHYNWRVQAVSLTPTSYVCRLFLPEEWQGLRDKQLCEVSGIEGCMFVHHTGFIGGNNSRNGALNMASKSIEIGKLKEV